MVSEADIVKHSKTGVEGEVTCVEFNRVWVLLKDGSEKKFMEWELEVVKEVRL